MSIDLSKFQVVSEAAEEWLSTVSLVAQFGQTGSVDLAFELLMPTLSTKDGRPYNLQDSYRKHVEVLDQARDLLAALSDSPVKWEHGRGLSGVARVPASVYPHVWSSAHEAAAGIARLALGLLAWPLAEITDPSEQRTFAQQLLAKCWKALTIPLDERAALCERIRRERAKLIASDTRAGEKTAKRRGRPKGETDKKRLVIAALIKHHGYQTGGSIDNPTPAKTKELAELASGKHVKVSVATVSRFLAEKFPDRRYKGYENACARGEIGTKLALWQGDVPDSLRDLRPEEYGRGEDD